MHEWTISTPAARLYAEPSPQAMCVDEALCGMSVSVLENHRGGWQRIRTEYGYEGYIKKSRLTPSPPPPNTVKRIVYAWAADILAAPDVKAPCLQTLTLGGAVYIPSPMEETVNGWARVMGMDGREGFMRAGYLRPPAERVNLASLAAAQSKAVDSPAIDALRERLIETAFLYRGAQYRWGGKTPRGIDCSGLCFMAYWLNGMVIWRDARIMPGYPVRAIMPEKALKGDLIFFPGHVGLSLGDGRLLHSSEAGNGVNVVSLTPQGENYDAKLAARVITAGSVLG